MFHFVLSYSFGAGRSTEAAAGRGGLLDSPHEQRPGGALEEATQEGTVESQIRHQWSPQIPRYHYMSKRLPGSNYHPGE